MTLSGELDMGGRDALPNLAAETLGRRFTVTGLNGLPLRVLQVTGEAADLSERACDPLTPQATNGVAPPRPVAVVPCGTDPWTSTVVRQHHWRLSPS